MLSWARARIPTPQMHAHAQTHAYAQTHGNIKKPNKNIAALQQFNFMHTENTDTRITLFKFGFSWQVFWVCLRQKQDLNPFAWRQFQVGELGAFPHLICIGNVGRESSEEINQFMHPDREMGSAKKRWQFFTAISNPHHSQPPSIAPKQYFPFTSDPLHDILLCNCTRTHSHTHRHIPT